MLSTRPVACIHILLLCTFVIVLLLPTTQAAVINKQQQQQKERILSDDDIKTYERDGYIIIRGLLSDDELNGIVTAGQQVIEESKNAVPFYFGVSLQGALFGSINDSTNSTTIENSGIESTSSSTGANGNTKTHHHDFRRVALYSKLPQVVAELMQLDPETQNVRVIRDIFLAKDIDDDKTCDWHVDDQGFWPESFISESTIQSGKDQNGVNVWLALDDMPKQYEGSMAVSPGSHKFDWRYDAYMAMGQDRTVDGGKSKEHIQELMKQRKNYPTCDMHLVNPDMYEQIEKTGVTLDIRRGDVIFATRTLLHRTKPVTDDGKIYYRERNQHYLSRYSIRYSTGTARLPNGWTIEWSVMNNPNNVGKTLDEIVDNDGIHFYPLVWPNPIPNLNEKIDEIAIRTKDLTAKAMAEMRATLFAQPPPTTTYASTTTTTTTTTKE